MAYLEIKNLCKRFGNNQVLKGVDMQIEKGQVVCIIGSSGSGKTTFLRCINFLETADSGEIILENQPLFNEFAKNDSDAVLREKRLNFGLVFQSFNLFPQYTVFQNIVLAPTLKAKESAKKYKKSLIKEKAFSRKQIREKLISFKNGKKEEITAIANNLLEVVGLSEKKDAYPCELSGGQCQRVAIARALALQPKILCFDEPTSALDPELTGEVLKVIKGLKNQDRTMIIVTHEMGFAKKVSDKIIFMADGVIEEEGSPEILDNPKSEKLKIFLANSRDKDGD